MTSLVMEAFRRGVTPPSAQTLRKYGMSSDEWLQLLADQGWRCPICLRDAGKLRLNTDHEHVRGFDKMPDREKKQYTRGILCAYCNFRRVHSTMSAELYQRCADYVRRYEERKAGAA